ncbi:PTS sugar transporter subunit IIC, partial [Bacillus subtilis]
SGLAAGAATIGCCAQMVGFAAAGFRENRFGGLAAVGIGTSKLQLPNIVKNPLILIPPTIAGLILAPIGIIGFGMVNN